MNAATPPRPGPAVGSTPPRATTATRFAVVVGLAVAALTSPCFVPAAVSDTGAVGSGAEAASGPVTRTLVDLGFVPAAVSEAGAVGSAVDVAAGPVTRSLVELGLVPVGTPNGSREPVTRILVDLGLVPRSDTP